MTQPWIFPQLPFSNSGYGYRTPYGYQIPPGGKVQAFVSSTTPSPFSGDEQVLQSGVPVYTTLAAALALCRAGKGDTVICLPGHVENVVDNTMLAALVNGTRILGQGNGSMQPTFTWTNTAGQWLLNKNDVTVAGLRLNLAGITAVVSPIVLSGADNVLADCDVVVSTAASKPTVALTVSAGADRGSILNTVFRGSSAQTLTNGLLFSGIVDRFRMENVECDFAAVAATGNIAITAAVTSFMAYRLRLRNTAANSTATLSIANVVATGLLNEVYSQCTTTGAGNTSRGIVFAGATAIMNCMQCFQGGDLALATKSGVINPPAVTT